MDEYLPNVYLQKLIQVEAIKRRKKDKSAKSSSSNKYTIASHGSVTRVCRDAFAYIFGISSSRVHSALKKVLAATGVPVAH